LSATLVSRLGSAGFEALLAMPLLVGPTVKTLMRIFLNDNVHSRPQQRGVSRYFRNVAEGVIRHFGNQAVVFSSDERTFGPVKHVRPISFHGQYRFAMHDAQASLASLWHRTTLFYSSYFGSARTRGDQVFTVYDMIYELFPQYFPKEDPWNRWMILQKRKCIERAAAVIAISESTARDILGLYPNVERSRVHVIVPGVDSLFLAADTSPIQRPSTPFFLYVGNRSLYKNFSRLLDALVCSALLKEYRLVVVSPVAGELDAEESSRLARAGFLDRVEIVSGVDDQGLRALYRSSTALLYPSQYEGFGLPVLEAMASGTLVATARAASLPEAGGSAALYFDPDDTESIADCLCKLVALSEGVRRDLLLKGRAHAAGFGWQRCQDSVVDLFASLGVRRRAWGE
jgi:glycosyltransferase involved in cell wall biosynthesis